jgi:hypothetical protein
VSLGTRKLFVPCWTTLIFANKVTTVSSAFAIQITNSVRSVFGFLFRYCNTLRPG